MNASARKSLAIYARVSSEKQTDDGSILSQVEELKSYAERAGLSINKDLIITDVGISGATLARPGLDRLRDLAYKKIIDCILVLCPDRLARKSGHQLIVLEEMEKWGVEVLFINREIGSSPEDNLLLQIQGVIAEYERDKVIERNRRGKLYKANSGSVNILSGAPFGYEYVRKSTHSSAKYEIFLPEAKIVRQIFAMYGRENLSITQIAKKLTCEKAKTRRGLTHWSESTIFGILSNPAYMGLAAYGKKSSTSRKHPTKKSRDCGGYPKSSKSSRQERKKDEWISIPVPPIVSTEIFQQVQKRKEINRKFSKRNQKHEYLLSGLIRCNACGYSVVGKPAKGSRGKYLYYYRCSGKDSSYNGCRRCNVKRDVRVEVIDQMVWDEVKSLIEDPKQVIEEYMYRVARIKRRGIDLQGRQAKKQRELEAKLLEKERIISLFQKSIITDDEMEPRIAEVRRDLKTIEDELRKMQAEKQDDSAHMLAIENLNDFSKKIGRRIANISVIEKREILRMLLSDVKLDFEKRSIEIMHLIPIDHDLSIAFEGSKPS